MKKSSLLINEPPLQVLPSLAKAIGLNEAIITQQLHYWLENPKAGVERNGFKWIFNTYDEWHENFPFWSVSTIQRIFVSLEGKKIVISAQLDAKSRDMRKYYRLDYDYLDTLQDINLTSSNTSHWHDVKGNTETTTENKVSQPISKEELAGTSFEAAIFGLEPITQEQFNRENNRNVAPRMFEKALGFSKPLPWWSNKEWSEFADWVVAEYSRSKTSFGEYNAWRNEKFTKGGIANTRLRGFPSEFSDSWDMFLMSKPQPTQSQEPAPKSFPTLVNGRVQR